MLNFTIYTADCVGNSGNCLYPNKMIVTDKDSFIAATKIDHVTAKYKGNYRSKDNFEFSDCIPLDCDNDHSDNPDDWVTPFDIALEIPGVVFAASYSRTTTFRRVISRQDQGFMCSSLYQRLQTKKSTRL